MTSENVAALGHPHDFCPVMEVHRSMEDLCSRALEHIMAIARETKAVTGKSCSVALSGGSSPKMLYALMRERHLELLQSGAFAFYFGDERVVLPSDERSNVKMATDALLHAIPPQYVHAPDIASVLNADGGRLLNEQPGEACFRNQDDRDEAAVACAAAYEALLKRNLCPAVPENGVAADSFPEFDIVLLGWGSDGHMASIFPGRAALDDFTHSVCAGFPSETMSPKVSRITITLPVIHRAKNVIVLATGREKHWVLQSVLNSPGTDGAVFSVASLLRQCRGKVWLLVDEGIVAG